MTLNVSLRVPDGIVLASDSLATLMSLVNQRINVSARLRALVCLFGLLALPPLAEGSDAPSVTFESFLTNPPAVERAEFDVIVGSRSLMQPHDVTRTFVEDGTNFLMSEVPMGAPLKPTSGYYFSGDFRGVRWHCGGWGNAGILMFCDPRLNTNPADPNNAFYWNETSAKAVEDNRGKINLMMHLGIQKMVSGSVEWKGGDTNFTAKFRGMGGSYVVTKKAGVPVATNYLAANGELRVHVTYGDGVPSMAQVEMAGRSPFWDYQIRYSYETNFFGGRLPVGWVVYHQNDAGDEKKMYAINIRALKLATGPVPLDMLNPRKALAGQWQRIGIWSNNIDYWVGRGHLVPVLTASAAQTLVVKRNIERNPGAVFRARLLILCVFLLAPLVFIWRRRSRTKI